MSGCRWLVNADPRVYYSQRSFPLIVSKSSLGTAPKDLLNSQASTTAVELENDFAREGLEFLYFLLSCLRQLGKGRHMLPSFSFLSIQS